MERLRRLGREAPSAATERLVLALMLSLGLHAFLFYHYASHHQSSTRPGLSIISARIAEPAPVASPAARPSVTPPPVSAGLPLPFPAILPFAEPVGAMPVPAGPVLESEPLQELPDTLETAAVNPDGPAPGLPDPVHYPAKELDVYPRLLGPVAIDYPETAEEQGGRVMLLLLVDESGRVTGVSVVDAQPEGVYEDAVTRAYSGAAFSPARKGGRAVRSRILVAVEIELASAAAAP